MTPGTTLAGQGHRRAWLIVLALVAAALAVWSNARLPRFMLDPAQREYGRPFPPGGAKLVMHNCLTAYAIAAYLSGRGQDPYVSDGRQKDVLPTGSTGGLLIDDDAPLHNPPAFVAVMRGVVRGLDPSRFLDLRVRWYLLELALVLGALAVSAALTWRCWPALLGLLPLVAVSHSWLQNLQFQQTQILMAALTLLGICAVAVELDVLGGIAIGLGTVANLTPIVLLLPIVLWRRWKVVAWTLATFGALSLASVLLDGWSVTWNYYVHVLPAVNANGGFDYRPEDVLKAPAILATQSLWGFMMKLKLLGLPALASLARPLGALLGVAILALGVLIGLRGRRASSRDRVLMLLGLVTLIAVHHMHFWDLSLVTPVFTMAFVLADQISQLSQVYQVSSQTSRSSCVGAVVELAAMAVAACVLGYGSPTLPRGEAVPMGMLLYSMLPTVCIFAAAAWALRPLRTRRGQG